MPPMTPQWPPVYFVTVIDKGLDLEKKLLIFLEVMLVSGHLLTDLLTNR